MKLRVMTSLVLALCLAVGSANASSIGVFFAADGNDCDADGVMPFAPFNIYILALLGGDAAAQGITGAEFLLQGVDPGWFNTITPGPGSNLQLGSPIVAPGYNIAWPGCQPGPTVTLASIQSLALAPVTGRTLQILARNPPTNPMFNCPLVTLCDPSFTKLCVPGGEAFLNRGVPCTVGVSPSTWTQVKGLYGN